MAINNIELRIGQTWLTRGGAKVTLAKHQPGETFCWEGGWLRDSYTDTGLYYGAGHFSHKDLSELVCEVYF